MDNSEKLCLTWNDFEEHLKSSFALLRNETDLTNVTLAFDDGKQLDVHKVILATSSMFFMEILTSSIVARQKSIRKILMQSLL